MSGNAFIIERFERMLNVVACEHDISRANGFYFISGCNCGCSGMFCCGCGSTNNSSSTEGNHDEDLVDDGQQEPEPYHLMEG